MGHRNDEPIDSFDTRSAEHLEFSNYGRTSGGALIGMLICSICSALVAYGVAFFIHGGGCAL